MVAEELRRRHAWGALRPRFQGLGGEGRMMGRRVFLLLPLTFMNRSGVSVGQAVRFYKTSMDELLVIHDESELPFGEVRLKKGGGLGGHHGLKSIEQHLRSRDFWRVRVGVGRTPRGGEDSLADYLLSPFAEPAEEVHDLVSRAADLVDEWLASGTDELLAAEAGEEPL